MIQFYFISVLLNVLGGYSLCADAAASRGSAFDGVRAFLRDRTLRLVLGILTAVTGAFKLLTVVYGDIPVVGDFLPAAAGLVVGTTILLDIYGDARSDAPKSEGASPRPRGKAEKFLVAQKGAIGIAGIIAGLVHFLFPMVMFL